jgi:ribosome recycling factor
MSDISSIIDDAKSKFNRAVEHLEEEMLKIRAVKPIRLCSMVFW